MRNKTQGFTLLEVMITTAVFSVILAAVLVVLSIGQESFSNASVSASLKTDTTILMDRLTESLTECKIVSAPVTGTQHATMTIQIPVLMTGTYWSADGETIYWGAYGNLNWTMTYQFNPKDTLDETVTELDYNQDNDILDKFERGELQLVFKDGGGGIQETTILSRNVIVVYGSRNADVDGDGTWDPLFLRVNWLGDRDFLNGNRIKINFWLSKTSVDGIPFIVNMRSERTLRNPQ